MHILQVSLRIHRSQDYGKTADYIGTEFPYGSSTQLRKGCLVIIDDETVFVAGGYSTGIVIKILFKMTLKRDLIYYLNCFTYILARRIHSETYFLNLANNLWSRGPDLSTAKNSHTCNLVMTDQRQIVVVGGYPYDNNLDIIDVDTKTKRQGMKYL